MTSETKNQAKEEVFSWRSLRTSRQKLRSAPPNPNKKAASVAATPPCSATPFQRQLDVRHPWQLKGDRRDRAFCGGGGVQRDTAATPEKPQDSEEICCDMCSATRVALRPSRHLLQSPKPGKPQEIPFSEWKNTLFHPCLWTHLKRLFLGILFLLNIGVPNLAMLLVTMVD